MPLLNDCSHFVCPTCMETFDTAVQYEMHAFFHVDAFKNPFNQNSCSSNTIKPIFDDMAVNAKKLRIEEWLPSLDLRCGSAEHISPGCKGSKCERFG